MKKLSKFAVAALLVLGIASGAQAADIKANGSFQIDSSWSDSEAYSKGNSTPAKGNDFRIEQRVRTAFQFIANENLKGVLETQIGSNSWGNGQYQISAGRTPSTTATGSNTAGAGNIMLRKAYIDFKWPDTKVNILAGFQTVTLPTAFGTSSILDDQVGALVVSAPISDSVKLLAGYARPYDSNTAGSTATVQGGGTGSNVLFAVLPVDLPGNTNITPFGVYADAGYQSSTTPAYSALGLLSNHSIGSDGIKAYWGGVAMSTKFLDPFKLMADFNYGSAQYSSGNSSRAGWLADFAVDYTGLSYMTPEAFFAYSSGDSSGTHKDGGRMPVLGNPQGSLVAGSMFFGNTDLITRTTSAASSSTTGAGGAVLNSMGFWTAGVALKDISFIDKLSHRINVLYVQGTNDKNAFVGATNTTDALYGSYLTTRDSLWEVDFGSKYKVYDELSLMLNLGYLNQNLHQYNGMTTGGKLPDDAYRVSVSMAYSF
ncbi:MAG: outer membrane homotrimeric porin [Humidesulfovibrio sp.]|nr:outer membrane homotrimeric porin [Humidesulfovibrio sp.]